MELSAILLEKQFHRPTPKSEEMAVTEHWYTRFDLLKAIIMVCCTVVVCLFLASWWIVNTLGNMVMTQQSNISVVTSQLTTLATSMGEQIKEINRLNNIIANMHDEQANMIMVIKENNASIRVLEEHPLLRDYYDDFGIRRRRALESR